MTDKAERFWLLGIALSLAAWGVTYLPVSVDAIQVPTRTTNQSQSVVYPLSQLPVVDASPVSVEPTMRQWDYPGAPSNTP